MGGSSSRDASATAAARKAAKRGRGKAVAPLAFDGRADLKGELIIPDGVAHLGFRAFKRCTGLTSVVLPSSVRSIRGEVFMGCSQLAGELVIPAGVEEVGERAFAGCRFTAVTLPESVKRIGAAAFEGCRHVAELCIPAAVQVPLDPTVLAGMPDTRFYRETGKLAGRTLAGDVFEGRERVAVDSRGLKSDEHAGDPWAAEKARCESLCRIAIASLPATFGGKRPDELIVVDDDIVMVRPTS